MDRTTELQLIDELLSLKADETHFLDASVARNDVSHYLSAARFAAERDKLFARLPLIVAHASEVSEAGDFLRRDVAGRSILVTRDKTGKVNAFLNVCRHRDTAG